MDKLNFYKNKLGNESFLFSTNSDELMAIPDIGDIIELPIRAEDDINSFDTDCYVIRKKIIYKNSIDYFCELYDWEASYEN